MSRPETPQARRHDTVCESMPADSRAETARLAIIERDRELPGLATLLDPVRLAKAAGLAGTEAPRIVYLRYKPGRRCLVAYRHDASPGPPQFYAQAVSPRAWQKYREKYGPANGESSPAVHWRTIADDCVTVFRFPYDRVLDVMVRIEDARERGALLAKLLADESAACAATIDTLAYKPERRFVGQVRRGDHTVGVLKCYTPAEYLKARNNAKSLRSGSTLRLAQVQGRSQRHRAIILDWLAGDRLLERLQRESVDEPALRRVGTALGEIHRQRGRRLGQLTRSVEAASLREVGAAIAFLLPELADQVTRLSGRLAAWLANLPVEDRPVHGDFYAKQIILNGPTVGVLDLDEAARGDPALDVGNFLAHQHRYSLRDGTPAAQLETIAAALLDGYAQSGREIDSERIGIYTAACLLRLAPHPFRHAERNWPESTAKLLDRVEAICALHDATLAANDPVAPAVSAAATLPDDPKVAKLLADPSFAFLADALHPARCAATIIEASPCLHSGDRSWQLRAVRVVRHKPGRRCILEFEFIDPKGGSRTELLGKVRAKGLRRDVFEMQQQLFAASFGTGADDGQYVPEPIGCLPQWKMWLQRKAPGERLSPHLLGVGGPRLARRVAELIFKLHGSTLEISKQHSLADELRILDDRFSRVAEQFPHWSHRLWALSVGCHGLAATLDEAAPRSIHRDFYPDQVLCDGHSLYLLDLDLLTMGDPALDVGNFIGHLIEQGVRDASDAQCYANVWRAFAARYEELAGVGLKHAIEVYTLLTVARHIYISTQFDDRRHATESLLELVEQSLAGGLSLVG
ncbi:MAG: aminoglycoside phosphotransferase family protein [Planctomycetales bacterium]|nr:aminoglycoside phosphotransferase family protein [Planctomycetales bacterium]